MFDHGSNRCHQRRFFSHTKCDEYCAVAWNFSRSTGPDVCVTVQVCFGVMSLNWLRDAKPTILKSR
jgi:hypothetical protein